MNMPEIIQMGNPKLRLVSEPINEDMFGSKELHELTESLFLIMRQEGGIGVAAPQLGINKRIFVFGWEEQLGYIPDTVLINPTFEVIDCNIEEGYEGCLSIGTIRGEVPRYTKIHYKGFDVDGKLIEREAEGRHARVVQHEYDHLDGILFVDRVKNYASLGFHEELIDAGLLPPKRENK